MAHANFIYYGLSPLPRPQKGIDPPIEMTIPDGSADRKFAWMFCLPETRNVAYLGFQLITIIDAGAKQFKISLQEVGSNGSPNGTILTSGTFKPDDLTEGPDFYWIPVTPQVEIDAGTFYAIVLEFDDVHPPNPLQGIKVTDTRQDFVRNKIPYAAFGAGISWSRVGEKEYPFGAGVRFTGTEQPLAFGNPIANLSTVDDANGFVTANVGERVAMRFKLPSELATNFKVAGLRILASAIAPPGMGGNKIKMGLWKHPDMLLQEKEIFPIAFWSWGYWELFFGDTSESSSSSSCPATPATLNYDTVYYVGFEQIEQASPSAELPAGLDLMKVREFDGPITYPYYDLDAFPGGREVFAAKYEEVDTVWQWTEFQYCRPMIDLILSDITGT